MSNPDPQHLTALADRVEAASGDMSERDHRELSASIARAIGWRPADGAPGSTTSSPWAWCPTFTASLDAAMTLVPEGWYWMAGNRDRTTPRAYVENGQPAFVGMSSRRNPERLWFEVTAATPALALTAAALRARAQLTDGD